MRVCVLSCFCRVQLFAALWTPLFWIPLFMGFSRQEYLSGLPCNPPGDLPQPGIEPTSPESPALQADSLPMSHQESPKEGCNTLKFILQDHHYPEANNRPRHLKKN